MSLLEETLRASVDFYSRHKKSRHILTVTDVRRMIIRVATAAAGCDLEGTARHERQCWFTVLHAIADGSCSDPRKLAVEALKTTEITYDRETK